MQLVCTSRAILKKVLLPERQEEQIGIADHVVILNKTCWRTATSCRQLGGNSVVVLSIHMLQKMKSETGVDVHQRSVD